MRQVKGIVFFTVISLSLTIAIKSIDGKSLLIGGLLASTIFFAMGSTSPTDKWGDKQEWEVATYTKLEKKISNLNR